MTEPEPHYQTEAQRLREIINQKDEQIQRFKDCMTRNKLSCTLPSLYPNLFRYLDQKAVLELFENLNQ